MWKRKTLLGRVLLILTSTLVSLSAVELALRTFSSSQQPLDYGDVYRTEGLGPGGFLRANFDALVEDGYGGKVRWTNNSQGFRNNKDFSVPPAATTYRILSMGDSFTGGYRVGQDQTFSNLLQQRLSARRPHDIEVMVCVVEDPLTGLYYLASRGAEYSPDLVLLGVTLGNDLAQVYANMGQTYGLTEDAPFVVRLDEQPEHQAWVASLTVLTLPDDCLLPRSSANVQAKPVWSDIYPWWKSDGLRLARLISQARRRVSIEAPQTVVSNWEEYGAPRLFDSNGLGIFLKRPASEIQAAYDGLFATLAAYRQFCRSRDLDLLVAIFPQRFQVQDRDWQKTLEVYGLREECFDRELPNLRIREFCERQGIDCVDTTQQLRSTFEGSGKSLYLPHHDMHWNAQGHAAVADVLTTAVDRMIEEQAPDRS
jgi:hypothetical protein